MGRRSSCRRERGEARTDGGERQRIEAFDVRPDWTGIPEVMQPPVTANLFAWDVNMGSRCHDHAEERAGDKGIKRILSGTAWLKVVVVLTGRGDVRMPDEDPVRG